MSKDSQNVVMMNQSSSKNNEDYKGLKSSIGFLDWALQTQALIKAMGLPIGDNLLEKETKLPIGSMAFNFGHTTIEEFITNNDEKMGVSWNWEKWTSYANAFRYKSFYGLHLDDPFEIINQYEDIKKILGRDPINSAEFHSAKERSFLNQKIEINERHEEEKRSLNAKIIQFRTSEISLRNEIEKIKGELESEKLSSSLLIRDSEALSLKLRAAQEDLFHLHSKYDEMKKEMDFKIEEAKRKGISDSIERFEQEKSFLNSKFESEKRALIDGYIYEVKSANERAESAKKDLNYAKSTMVSKEQHSSVLNELKEERNKVNMILLNAHNAETKWLELSGINEENQIKIKTLQEIMNRQESLIESIKSSSETGFSSYADIYALEKKVEKLDEYARNFKNMAITWKGKYEKENSTSKALNEKITEITGQVKQLKTQIKALKSQKTSFIKYSFIGFLLGGAFCATMFFVF